MVSYNNKQARNIIRRTSQVQNMSKVNNPTPLVKHFEDKNEEAIFVIDCKKNRRQLTSFQKVELELRKRPYLKDKAKESQKEHGGTAPGKSKDNTSEVRVFSRVL